MADNSFPKVVEPALPAAAMENVTHVRVVSTDNSEKLPINNLTIAGTKVTVAVDGLSGTVDGAFGDVLTAIAEKADTTQVEALNVAKANDNAVVHLTGNETIAGVKTFSSSPVVPTPTTDMQAATKKYGDDILAAYGVDVNNVCGAVNHYKRVLADAGGILDRSWLLKVYEEYIKQRPETVRLYIPELGAKERVSGLNKYGAKVYDMSTVQADASQATEATQPFMTINAAPNARKGIRFVQGQAQTGLLDFTDVAFAAGASWTLTKRVKINNKGTGRVYLGAAWIETTATTIVLNSGSVAVLTGTYNFECGRTYTIEFQYSNGAGLILVNGQPIVTVPLSGAITFGQISYSTTYPADRVVYAMHLTNTRKATVQSQLDHAFLSTLFPDMESVTIGNQVWSTDNFCGTVAGDGTVIPEVQGATTDGNTELITNAADREFSSDTGWWTKKGDAAIGSGVATYTGLGAHFLSANNWAISRAGFFGYKAYRVKVYARLVSGGGVLRCGIAYREYTAALTGVSTEYTFWFFGTGPSGALNQTIAFGGDVGSVYEIDNVSIKEVGASDSTLVYNYVYDATSGSASVKDLAATKAAAMWCHYDNSAANGAVYGKMYNWYAVHLFDLLPPVKGWRVPSKADFDQLETYLGGASVAGTKLKAKFGAFDTAYSSNESGFSSISGGQRSQTGAFIGNVDYSLTYTSTQLNADLAYRLYLGKNEAASSDAADAKIRMCSIRLLRNEPAGANELSYTSGLFTTDITSAAKQIPISFGRMVDAIRIKSENALTAIEAKLHNAAGTAVATLITGKTMNAGETKMFTVSADWVSLLQDGTVRVTAAGNSGSAVGMEIEVLTHKGVLS